MDGALLVTLEKAYHLLKTSFVRFLVESSESQILDDLDRRVYALLEGWSRELEFAQASIGDLLSDAGVFPGASAYNLDFSQYNYLRPTYLLRAILERAPAEIQELDGLAKEVGAWTQAADLLTVLTRRQREYLERARKLEESRPKGPPAPPRVKGTSASRW